MHAASLDTNTCITKASGWSVAFLHPAKSVSNFLLLYCLFAGVAY